jgi:hypothetical protein
MPARVPADLSTLLRTESGLTALQHELRAEGAATLGRLGRAVEAALRELRALDEGDATDERRETLLYASAEVVWRYFVQREAFGLVNHDPVIEAYAIPREVLARVGATPPPPRAAADRPA